MSGNVDDILDEILERIAETHDGSKLKATDWEKEDFDIDAIATTAEAVDIVSSDSNSFGPDEPLLPNLGKTVAKTKEEDMNNPFSAGSPYLLHSAMTRMVWIKKPQV